MSDTPDQIPASGCWKCAIFDQCDRLEKGTPYPEFWPVSQCDGFVPMLNDPDFSFISTHEVLGQGRN
jgi:hypothetical protein